MPTIRELLSLKRMDDSHFATSTYDANPTGVAFGGQVMAHALMSSGERVSSDLRLAYLHAMFIRGTEVNKTSHYKVDQVHAGRRFSTFQVMGTQDDNRRCLAVYVTYKGELSGVGNQTPLVKPLASPKEAVPLAELPPDWTGSIASMGYPSKSKAWMDFRLATPKSMDEISGSPYICQYWAKPNLGTYKSIREKEAILTYISDIWINFPCLLPFLKNRDERRFSVVTLNHSLWIWERDMSILNEWWLIESRNEITVNGRAMAEMTICAESGHTVATASQECLLIEM